MLAPAGAVEGPPAARGPDDRAQRLPQTHVRAADDHPGPPRALSPRSQGPGSVARCAVDAPDRPGIAWRHGARHQSAGTPHPLEQPVIHTRKLTKNFTVKKETVEAVKGVDIDVAPGELVAFLGPNGAGKSTTLRMLTTLLRPTSGISHGGRAGRRGGSGRGAGPDRLHRPGQRRRPQLPRDRRDGHAGPLLRNEHHGRHGPGRGTAEVPGPRRPRQTHRHQALRRPAAADGRGPGPDALAPAAVPRRAVHRHGPAEPREPLGAHHAHARRARDHHRADHALHGRGGFRCPSA